MGRLLDSLIKYLENTPQEVLEEEWNKVKHLNEFGPDAVEYCRRVKAQYNSYDDLREEREFFT